MSQSDIINSRQIQWFPGHMTKTLRLMEKEIRNVDCVLQILDARIPLSSLNPEIERITAGQTAPVYTPTRPIWLTPRSPSCGWPILRVPAPAALPWIRSSVAAPRPPRAPSKRTFRPDGAPPQPRHGRRGHPCHDRGHPQCGQVHLHQLLCGHTRAKAANKSGVTRGKQWISVGNFDLMDMPWRAVEKNSTRWKRHRIWHSSAPSAMTFWILRAGLRPAFQRAGAFIPPSCWLGISWRSRRLRCRPTTFAGHRRQARYADLRRRGRYRACSQDAGRGNSAPANGAALAGAPAAARGTGRTGRGDGRCPAGRLGRRAVTRRFTPLTPQSVPSMVWSAAWTRRAAARCAALSAVRRSS